MNEKLTTASTESHAPAQTLAQRLSAHPQLLPRVAALLALLETPAGQGRTAAQAEARVREALRQLGQQVLCEWSARTADQAAQAVPLAHPQATKHVKKK